MRYNKSMKKPKQIFLEKKWECVPGTNTRVEDLLGTFLDESHYDVLLQEDCDVYKPIPPTDKNPNLEDYLLLKFRKGVFSQEMQKQAYSGLRDAAVESQNRGIAAGPRTEKSTGRDWVTLVQERVLDILSGNVTTVTGDDPVAEAFVKYKDSTEVGSRGQVWLTLKRPKGFDFESWASVTKALPWEERLKEVEKVNDWISDTSYANPVHSGIAGYFDRYPRIPYCRTTSYTSHQSNKFSTAVPFIERISELFNELIPGRWAAQNKEVANLDPAFRIGNSAYTTITVNKTYRTAAHRDAGDLPTGFGNLSVVSNGIPYGGAYLVFPAFRAAVDVQPGDLIMMDVHEIHGNTPITGEGERISVVCYMREKMSECKSKAYEEARFNFVESRRLNKNHPNWHDKWNGISAGMWESVDWRDYLMESGLHEYADQMHIGTFATLDI